MPHASWGRACTGSIKTLVRSDGVKLPVRLELLELVKLLCDETERLGYNLIPGWCWGYACRDIRGRPGVKSNHAWGLAVDLNAPENPMGPRTGKIRKFPAVIALWERYGFRSGTKYSGRADDMHMEFMGSVADAAAQTERARRELGGHKPTSAPPFTLTPGQIKWLAKSVGLSDDDATIAVAVALAESSGVVKAFNGKAPDASYGLWQINMHGPLGPDRRKRLGLPSNEALFDPLTNARAMKLIRADSGGSWRPWATFKSGAYLKHLPKATTANPEPIPGAATAPLPPPQFEEEDEEMRGKLVTSKVKQEVWYVFRGPNGLVRRNVNGPAFIIGYFLAGVTDSEIRPDGGITTHTWDDGIVENIPEVA